jgi:hypothetical protein
MAEPAVLDPKTGQPAVQPKPDEKPKELSKEAKDGLAKFAHSFLPEKFDAVKVETPEEKAAREKKEKTPKLPAKPKVQSPVQPAPLTADQIAEAAARGVATAMAPKKEETKPDAQAVEYTEDEKETLRVLEHMEKIDPSKKGVSEKWKKAKVELHKYAEQWETDHPGQEFDAEAEEHNAWFDANEPKYEQNEFDRAKWRLEDDADREKERKEFNDRLSVFERKEKLREAEPEIFKAQTQPAQLLWNSMGPEFKELVGRDGQINMEKMVELKKADPLTFPTRMQAANALNAEVSELYKVMNGLSDFDDKNPIHINISNFAADQEAKLAAKPIEDRVNAEGKDFLPAEQYYKLSAKKREEFWTFSVRDVAALRASNLAETTKNLLDAREKEHEAWAEARGFSRESKPAPAPTPRREEEEVQPEPADGKPLSPSVSAESRLTASRRASGAAVPDASLTFMDRQLGKK